DVYKKGEHIPYQCYGYSSNHK
ncbi:hypothetical protein AZ004_003440, partial [Escherichia coli]